MTPSKTVNSGESPEASTHDSSGIRVEEKIARAYHEGMSWRKVLVRLEPDAHNNMVVRRMFSNAYGWPVVKHLVETHFADSGPAAIPDDEEGSEDATDKAKESGAEAQQASIS